MALSYTEKQAVVAEVAEVAGSALSAVAAEYRGLSVSQLTDIRDRCQGAAERRVCESRQEFPGKVGGQGD